MEDSAIEPPVRVLDAAAGEGVSDMRTLDRESQASGTLVNCPRDYMYLFNL
jgi:hypothetical protein